MLTLRIVTIVFASLVTTTSAKSFLRQVDTREEVEASLMRELAGTFRAGATQEHIMKLEAKLESMYTAVPQNADGSLSHSVVRYVLHRFFAAHHGWFIRGLEPAGNARNTSGSQTLQGLQEWVPSFLQNFLEELAGGRGISLRELAVLAATIEDLIHKEALARLEQAFESLEMPLGTKLDDAAVKEVLEVYMMIYFRGGNFTVHGKKKIHKAHLVFEKKKRDWARVQEWVHSIKQQLYPSDSLDFSSTGRVVEALGEQFGAYNDKECAKLKSELLDIESKKAGRVRLTDFYKKGLSGEFDFTEKAEYLRAQGTLDETDANQPLVIIPNYVGSRPNCMKASNFYVVCCRNECEDLMEKLERKFASEMVEPEDILKVVGGLSTGTVDASRKLSPTLVQRLHSIAKSSGGRVPLHGRLFAQWMHHAFPRECPFPHEAGNVSPLTPDEWMQETGQADSKLSKEEILAHVGSQTEEHPTGAEARKHHHFAENELPWSETEELLLPVGSNRQAVKPKQQQARRPSQSIFVFLLLSSMASGFVWAAKSWLSGVQSKGHSTIAGCPPWADDLCKMASDLAWAAKSWLSGAASKPRSKCISYTQCGPDDTYTMDKMA